MVKYLNDTKTIEEYINFLKKAKRDFTWKFTSYTHTIECNGNKEFFFDGQGDNFKMFIAQKKIEKDIREAERSGLYLDDIQSNKIMYNQFNAHLLTPNIFFGEVYNIDLKSAYLQALYNLGLVKKDTFDYVQAAPKPVRLKAVGMLATTKNCFHYTKGNFTHYTSQTKDLRKYFFIASYIVGELLTKLKNMCSKEEFIFFWVDGIYILNRGDHNYTRSAMKQLIEKEGFKYSEELLTDFKTTEKSISYMKGDTEKIFPLPKEQSQNLKQFQKNEIKQLIIK